MARARTTVAAHILAYVNNRPYGRVTGLSFGSATPREAIYGIDSIDPAELAIQRTKIAGTLEIIKTAGDGGAEGSGFVAPYEQLPREKYFSLILIDRMTDRTVFRADYCSINNQRWSIEARGIMRGTLEFEALTWSNEVR